MGRKKKSDLPEAPKPNAGWIVLTEIQINGRYVSPGTELKITGERGRFRFMKHVDTGTADWIDVWGGPKGAECIRSFKLDRETVKNLAAEYKEKKKAIKAENDAETGGENLLD
jgi:hypothetical protein